MDDAHVACLSKLFDEIRPATDGGPDEKSALVVVDKSLDGQRLANVAGFFADTVAVKFTDVSHLDRGRYAFFGMNAVFNYRIRV